MRIALCGRGGTGKTTLAKELAPLLGLHLITEGVRSVCGVDLGGIGIRNLKPIDRLHLQIALAQNQLTTERIIGNDFITDRSIWDYYAYTAVYSEIDRTFFFQQAARYQEEVDYDHLILVPGFSDDPAVDDNFRFNDKRLINHELDVEDILRLEATYVLESKTVAERVEEIIALIDGTLAQHWALP